MISEVTKQLLQLSLIKGVGNQKLLKARPILETNSHPLEDLMEQLPENIRKQLAEDSLKKAAALADAQITQAQAAGVSILSPFDEAYPELLAKTHDAPQILFVKGNIGALEKSAAVIGTRHPTRHGVEMTKRITTTLVEDGYSIVSGLAIGCDSTAHQACLDAGGHTIAVMGHGLHTVYPRGNKRLAEEILEAGGALVSQYHMGTSVAGYLLAIRDRVQAGLAHSVFMMQSSMTGGSLNAPRAALSYGRAVAVPFPTHTDFDGDHENIQANLVLCGTDDDAKRRLLKCKRDQLNQVTALYGKKDVRDFLARERQDAEPEQQALDLF